MRHMNHTANAPDALVGTAELARLRGESVRTVQRRVHRGELTPAVIAPGGRAGVWLFRRDDAERAGGAE